MLHPLKRLLEKAFPKDILLRLLPLLLMGFGLLLYGLSFLVRAGGGLETPLKELGLAVLVSGVIGTILKSLTYIGVFRDAMRDVVYGHDFLALRKDLSVIWSRATSALCENKFPELKSHLDENVTKKYLPTLKDFYYSDYHRTCILRWHDKKEGIVSVKENIEITINPSPTANEVIYTFSSVDDPDTPLHSQGIDLHYFSIRDEHKGGQGQCYKGRVKTEIVQVRNRPATKTYYAIPLKADSKYRVFRSMTRKLCLDADPILNYSSEQFILRSSVKIGSPERDLDVHFIDVGAADFEDMPGADSEWRVRKELGGLMFPNQGYIMVIHRQPLGREGCASD